MNTREFLQVLYDDDAPGHLTVWTRRDHQTLWLPARNLTVVGPLAVQLATTDDVYFGAGLQDKGEALRRQGPTTRGTSETVLALPGFFQDLDVKGVAHKKFDLPSWEEVWTLISSFLFKPTLIVHSGHGLQSWWLFKELLVFENEQERQRIQGLLRRFQVTFNAEARRRGWNFDNISDLARVLRLPGTWNRKLQPVPVRVIEYNQTYRYNLSDFEEYLIDVPRTEDHARQQWHGESGAVAPVLGHCRFIQYCQEHATDLPEPLWYPMISNLARLEGGSEAIHALSQPYSRYSTTETDKKIAHALRSAGPHTCRFIQQSGGFTGCPSGGCGVKAPAGLGVSKRAIRLVEARERHAAVVEQAERRRAQMQQRAASARARLGLVDVPEDSTP